MRSQTAKPVPKKGALGKISLKPNSAAKQVKKKAVTSKKVKPAQKSVLKGTKKKAGDDAAGVKNESDCSIKEKNDLSSTGITKIESVKPITSRADSPTQKSKKDHRKETKDKAKVITKKVVTKKSIRLPKTRKSTQKGKKGEKDEDIKYKINLEAVKKVPTKMPKTISKANVKKGNLTNQKKIVTSVNKDVDQVKKDNRQEEEKISRNEIENENDSGKIESKEKNSVLQSDTIVDKEEYIKQTENIESTATQNITVPSTNTQIETPKTEVERPPKFFTSSRSPRTVDIDVKCCKNSKGNLSVSERFLSMKCDDNNKDKNSSNNLVSQGPDIDVYTFTEKVDSPKSILSDFRPIVKNVGRVRPIARVKGTVINKKTDTERKKYSPHRPIEEVVKQLKANKRSEDFSASQNTTNYDSTGLDFNTFTEDNQIEEKPPIVSKSYKMVARKSSITGKPFSPIKFLDQEPLIKTDLKAPAKSIKKNTNKKRPQRKSCLSDEEINTSTFSLNTKTLHYTSSEESLSESNDDNDNKESSGSDYSKSKKTKNKKYKKITDGGRKKTSKELKELSKDSLIDLKDTSVLLGNEKPSKRRLKLLSMWNGPKKHRMASLNALAKVHCLYENESRTHMELGLMKTVDRQIIPSTSKGSPPKKKDKSKETEKQESTSTSESEYENKKESSDSSDDSPPQRTLRGVPGIRSAGKYWDPKSSTSSSEDSELESQPKNSTTDKKKIASKLSSEKSESDKPPAKMKKTAGVPVKKKRNRNEVVMDLKDMVVQKRMASLNATAILAASYEKRSPKSSKDETTSDSCSDESFSQKPKNVTSSGVKSELKSEDIDSQDIDDTTVGDIKQKVEVIVNQDTDVTITGVYSTHHHEGFCTVSGMQYRISSTSHTQTTATANCEKEVCTREDGSRYTPLTALSSMQPPAEHPHPHPVPELGGLARRAAGCSSAFSAPSPAAHHDPGKTSSCSLCDPPTPPIPPYGYYQPAGPLIKESSAEAERALARYHPPPHYHAPHPPVLQQYGPPYYQTELCYGRYYRPPGPYHMGPPQPDAQMVNVASEPYPPPQYYGSPPCYQHSPQRIPYVEYRGCPCPLNACPKNVLIGPATGKAPAGAGPDVLSALAPPGGAFRPKVRACALDSAADNHGSGKDPPLEPEPPEPPMAADAPHPCPLPAIGGASPKREMFDVRENLQINADIPGPEAVSPPSPARGACAPQPPQRRARLGKAMARRSLVGDDTTTLISPQQPIVNNDADDDVLALSPPTCVPIDLSSSDERSTPLVDVKKENEGPTYATSRKTDTQALREHNSSGALTDAVDATESAKAVKRRHSKPKLEIEMKDVQLEDACKTNGIGEHVKLQKRRKVSEEHTNTRIETVTKETKKKTYNNKRTPKTSSGDKKAHKRKSDTVLIEPQAKKILLDPVNNDDPRLVNIAAIPDDSHCIKPKTKSALLLDNLIRKNSIDRPDAKGYISDTVLNPAELFLLPDENVSQKNTKKTLNINNNIVDNNVSVTGVRPNTIAAVSQLIEKKLAYKNACKVDKVDSKVTSLNQKSVLSAPTESLHIKNDLKNVVLLKSEPDVEKCNITDFSENDKKKLSDFEKSEIKDTKVHSEMDNNIAADIAKVVKALKCTKSKSLSNKLDGTTKSHKIDNLTESHKLDIDLKGVEKKSVNDLISDEVDNTVSEKPFAKRCKLTTDKANGEFKSKNVEKLVKLLASKKQAANLIDPDSIVEDLEKRDIDKDNEKITTKRCKLTSEKANLEKSKAEKVVKLLVSKKTVIKTDEASLVVEDACSSPIPSIRKTRRRRSGGRRIRRIPVPLAPPDLQPKAPPRWSNGWTWDGEHYLSKVYLNNDSRLDRTARCWPRMTHASGDRVARGDCVLLRASQARAQPFVARIASLWENPDDGEMMVSLVWYYRPEHTELGRLASDAPDEVFASRHRDANSVACIEDKCYVLTFNEYCRYKKRLKAAEEGITIAPSIVPPLPSNEVTPLLAPNDTKLPPSVSPELVLFCRKIYDFRSKKIQVPNK